MTKRVNKAKVKSVDVQALVREALGDIEKVKFSLLRADATLWDIHQIRQGPPRKCYCGECSSCKASARSKRYRDKKKNMAEGLGGKRVSGSADWLSNY